MARHKKKNGKDAKRANHEHRLHPETKKSILAVVFLGLAILFSLAGLEKAGPAGAWLYRLLHALLGIGYFILPLTLLFIAGSFFFTERKRFVGVTLGGAALLVLSVLGLIHIYMPGKSGWLGYVLGSLKIPFGDAAAAVLNGAALVAAILMTANVPLRWPARRKPAAEPEDEEKDIPMLVTGAGEEKAANGKGQMAKGKEAAEKIEEQEGPEEVVIAESKEKNAKPITDKHLAQKYYDYKAPPLSLLLSDISKPTTGDLRANANIIKRTLESFGIPVEMGEINIGPKVTRYTLKPAEGVKLSRITALSQDLALVLAAHPIRIEAPIPGKSLVGVEVPNKTAALVRLGSLMAYKEFADSGPLGFALGRDVTGEPVFANIDKMPHLLVAGATGSGKSVIIHSLLTSLFYKNSPATLRTIMIDPKRVELSNYEGLPHLVSPVVTDNKKAIAVFRWALAEMDRRYDILLRAGNRDVKGYNAGHKDNVLPYILIVVDELADLMTSYGREVEGSIVRLAQMARATGIHLVLATQRPSVEIITGLIKANISARIALQVASQIDSRTILDTSGAEKLLGGGDLLFTSSELSQPRRLQGAYITEEEITRVAGFIRNNNATPVEEPDEEMDFANGSTSLTAVGGEDAAVSSATVSFDEFMSEGGDDDELYEEAVATVVAAKKASASLLQRRLKVGYARAARLLDIMEERGVIGPGEGAKPREVYVDASGVDAESTRISE